VGVFPGGDTPQGLADMSGNVFEWTGSLYRPYPYVAGDGRENPDDGEVRRVVRGGSWFNYRRSARCASRYGYVPDFRDDDLGFRVLCVSPIP
jgi:formylglycine-generating enzyme required for sulfatase activity